MDESLQYLHRVATSVVYGSRVRPGEAIGAIRNTTPWVLRVPGATREYYPCFWVRDAAMMLGADFIDADEVAGWVRLVASVQNGDKELALANGLCVPPWSIPDHITLAGAPCWYPGAMDGPAQGDGTYGFLPPADNAFYFIAMVREHLRLRASPALWMERLAVPSGTRTVREACERAFQSVEADAATGLVICSEERGRTRVDWGFCDTVRKTGLCLFPSLLRWRAALDLAELCDEAGDGGAANRWRREATRVRRSIGTFYRRSGEFEGQEAGLLLSATGLGRKDDLWGSAFAVWLGVLDPSMEAAVARGLARAAQGDALYLGQLRHLTREGPYGGFWEQCSAAQGTYQNGGHWGTPTGWLVDAVARADARLAERILTDYVTHIRGEREQGAPWEWISPEGNARRNPQYAASAALPWIAIQSGHGRPSKRRRSSTGE